MKMFKHRSFFAAARALIVLAVLSSAVFFALAAEKKTVGASSKVPKAGDPAPGDPVYEATKSLHTTGQPQDVDIRTWRLVVTGEKAGNPLSLAYQDLEKMEMADKNVVLVCPGVFTDRADWEGVPLKSVLSLAQVGDDWSTLEFRSVDGFRSSLSRKEVEGKFTILALKVNGVTLPKEHGFPLRLVAEDVSGGKWVKWIDRIEVK
jgi:sulfoxide reductase catalytic subunit YedY